MRRVSASVTPTSPRSCSADQRVQQHRAARSRRRSRSPRGSRKNGTFRYGALCCRISSRATASGLRPHVQLRQHRSRSGGTAATQTAAAALPASKIAARDQPPLRRRDRCCSISSASEPSVRPRQNMKPISYDGKNCAGLQDARRSRRATRPATPTISPRCCRRADAGGSTVVRAYRRALALVPRPADGALAGCDSFCRSSAGTSAADGVLAQLQRADVGGDRPAIARRDLRARSRASRRSRWSSRRRSGRPARCRSRSMWYDGGWR